MVDKIVNPALVANAYQTGLKAGATDGMDAAAGGINFGDLIKSGLQNIAGTLRAGDAASAQAVAGKADLNDVVSAITQAEMTLQTVVAIRDRLVSAYQDLLRMPI